MLKLIDFYADWCGPCQAMKPVFEKVMPEYEGKVILEKIDVDKEQEKASQFGVMSIPTLVMMEDEKEVDRKIGMLDENTLKGWLDSKVG